MSPEPLTATIIEGPDFGSRPIEFPTEFLYLRRVNGRCLYCHGWANNRRELQNQTMLLDHAVSAAACVRFSSTKGQLR